MLPIHSILSDSRLRKRCLLVIAASLVCVYAITVLVYVQAIPYLGVRTLFSPVVLGVTQASQLGDSKSQQLQPKDTILRVGNVKVESWADLVNAPFRLRNELQRNSSQPWVKYTTDDEGQRVTNVLVEFQRDGDSHRGWCVLGTLPLEQMVPSVLWFSLKMMLLLVGVLVLWKRPDDIAARQFFLLCFFSLGAYMGGYHWPYLVSQPLLLLVFMCCAVFLPVVSLHFYLIFPKRKPFVAKHPQWTFAVIYGLSAVFLIILIFLFLRLRSAVQHQESSTVIDVLLMQIRDVTYVYFGVASAWYLGCIVSLIHSFATVRDETARNQVRWILLGAVLAAIPISYSLYLAVWRPELFGAGAATWPMFAASMILTTAFAISITRYRLMEVDKILTSGFGYFVISFAAALIYYALIFVGTLVFNQVIASPKLSEALTVSATALLLMVVLDVARGGVKKVLDKRFSRNKSQLDQIFERMGQAIEHLVEPPALAHRLLQASTELLGASRGAVYLREGDPPVYRLAVSSGQAPPEQELGADSPLIVAVGQQGVLLIRSKPRDEAEQQLQVLGGEFAQALSHEGRILAVLLLGSKDSVYRPEDLNLLAAFGQITALALESAEEHHIIEDLNHELQAKVDKVAEQQRRILALQSQLRRQTRDGGRTDEEKSSEAEESSESPEATRPPGGIVGSGPVVRNLLHLVRQVSSTEAVVLIRGESGTGKELLAHAIHETSPRAAKRLIKVHCAALSPGLLESELFGHVKGAFTGAHRDKVGRFEMANGGTVFLDEIGDISLDVQTKLLRVLQEKTFERVGSSEQVSVDVRIIAATHQDLEESIRQGTFREDLFYRLNVFPILVPPLRHRPEDIAELATHFLYLSAKRCRKEVTQIDDDVLMVLKSYHWPGNIRQLENVIERAVVIAEGDAVTMSELPRELLQALERGSATVIARPRKRSRYPYSNSVDQAREERDFLAQALEAAGGNKAEAARALGVARSTLVSRLKKHGLL